MDDEVKAFYEEHCKSGGVVMAEAYRDGEHLQTAVFTSLDKAHQWADGVSEATDRLFVPYVLDCPEYGNVPLGQRN